MNVTATVTTCLVVCLLAPASALAESGAALRTVRSLDQRAQAHFEVGDYDSALDELGEAQRLLPAAVRLFSIAACHQRLGHVGSAIEFYQRFLEDAPAGDTNRDLAQRRLEELRAERDRQIASLSEDDEESTEATDSSEDAGAEAPPSRRNLSRAPFFAMVGVTGVSTLTMTILGSVTLSWEREFEQTNPGPRYDQLQEDGRAMGMAADVFLGLACVSAAVAVVLAIFTDWSRRNRAGSRRSVHYGLDPGRLEG